MSPANPKHATSDHVNYLIWRYLQENGFGEAAVKLQHKWHNDPQSLPFHTNVGPKALPCLVQKGLEYHALQVQVTSPEIATKAKTALNLYFGTPEGRQLWTSAIPIRKQSDDPATGPAKGPRKTGRPLSSATTTVTSATTAGLSLEPPAVKRQRRSGGGVEASTNSDSMQVDSNGFTDHDRPENESDANHDSPAENGQSTNGMEIDDEPATPTPEPTLTLNIGESKGVQLDQPIDLADKAIIQSLSPPNQVLMHLAYNPQDPSILAAGGEALARIWRSSKTAGPTDTSSSTTSTLGYCDILPPSDDSYVSALAWSPNGEVLALASRNSSPSGLAGAVSLWTNQGKCIEELPATQELVFKLCWNAIGTRLLGLTSEGNARTSVIVWEPGSSRQPLPHEIQTELRDVAWTSDAQFAVCGKRVVATSANWPSGNLVLQPSSDPNVTSQNWTHLLQGCPSSTTFIAANDLGRLVLIGPQGEIQVTREAHEGELIGLEPQPFAKSVSDMSRVMISSGGEGTVKLWDANNLEHLSTLNFDSPSSPALCLSFTPDGHLFAAGNSNRIFVWNTHDLGPPKAMWKREISKGGHKKSLTNGNVNGANGHVDVAMDYDSAIGEDAEDECRPLSWDALGKKLVMGIGSQFVILDLGP